MTENVAFSVLGVVGGNQILFAASIPLIAEFLTYLFLDEQLAPDTVAGY